MKLSIPTLLFLLLSLQLFAQSSASLDKDKLFELYQTQRYGEAGQYLKSIYGDDIKDPKVLNQIGYCFLMSGNTLEAEKAYMKAYEQQPNSLPVLFNLAAINSKRGNTEKAKFYYKEIIRVDSNNFNAFKSLANLYTGAIDIDKFKYQQQANKLNPLDADIAFDLCDFYIKMNILSKAEAVLSPALDADSNNLQLLKVKMPLCLAARKYTYAIETGKKLLNLGDSSTFVLTNLAKAHYMQKEYQEALNYFLKIPKSQQNEGTYFNAALCSIGMKNYVKATEYIKLAIDDALSGNIANYYAYLGDSYEKTGQPEQAALAYKKGLPFKDNDNLYYNLGLIYETKLNDKKSAIYYYTQYMNTIPDNEINKPNIDFYKKKIAELKK